MASLESETTSVHSQSSDPESSAVRAAALVDHLIADAATPGVWDEIKGAAENPEFAKALSATLRERLPDFHKREDAQALVTRALRFHEEWFGDGSVELSAFLEALFALDVHAHWWAIERLSVLYTSQERWSDVLGLYDRALAQNLSPAQRIQALDEASQCAKDFAAQPEKAIAYLSELVQLDETNLRRFATLERLLERHERWQDLAATLQQRAEREGAEGGATRIALAELQRTRLGTASSAIVELEWCLDHAPKERAAALSGLEAVLGDDTADLEARHGALRILRATLAEAGESARLAENIERGIAFSEEPSLLAELNEQLAVLAQEAGDEARALQAASDWLIAEPASLDAQALLDHLAKGAKQRRRMADTLVTAASRLPRADLDIRERLVGDAAEIYAAELEDVEAAAALYENLLPTLADAPAQVFKVASRLAEIYALGENSEAELRALRHAADAAGDARTGEEARWKLARRARELGEFEVAAVALRELVNADASDWAALDALIDLLRTAENWPALVVALRQRVRAEVPDWQRRLDLIDIAEVQAEQLGETREAVATWEEVSARFGRDSRVVLELSGLYSSLQRWRDVEALVSPHLHEQKARLTESFVEMGQIREQKLEDPEAALSDYLTVLALKPDEPRALAGLERIGALEGLQEPALLALEEAYLRVGDSARLVALTPALLELEAPLSVRGARAERAAVFCEDELADLTQALDWRLRMLRESPGQRAALAAVVRLALAAGAESESAQLDAAHALAELAEREVARSNVAAPLWLEAGKLLAAAQGLETGEAQLWIAQGFVLEPSPEAQEALRGLTRVRVLDEAAQALLARSVTESDLAAPLLRLALNVFAGTGPCDAYVAGLLRLSVLVSDALPPLEEAFEVCAAHEIEMSLALEVTRALHEAWLVAARPEPQRLEAIERTLVALKHYGAPAAEVLAATEASARSLTGGGAAGFFRSAAEQSRALGEERGRTTRALLAAFAADPTDDAVAADLSAELEAQGRLTELLEIKRSRLERANDPGTQLGLRLDMAKTQQGIEAQAQTRRLLELNLEAQPGHEASCEALARYHEDRGDFESLAAHLRHQGSISASLGDTDRALALWRRCAVLQMGRLRDAESGIATLREALTLRDDDVDFLTRLADAELAANDLAAAAQTLQRLIPRLEVPARAERYSTLVACLDTLGLTRKRVSVLVDAFGTFPEISSFRDGLLAHYREDGNLEALVDVIVRSVPFTSDETELLAFVHEAVEVLENHLKRPEDGLALIRRALEVLPNDRALSRAHARALVASGELSEAQAVLETLIDAFGQRRNAERAALHAQLAQVLNLQSCADAALEQLQLATEIDNSNLAYLEQLGHVARTHGELELAERSFRTLLLLVRRQTESDRAGSGRPHVTVAQVHYHLAGVAEARGDAAKADEMFESASDAAAHSQEDALGFSDALVRAGQETQALEVLRRRIERTDDRGDLAILYTRLAALLEADGSESALTEAFSARAEVLRIAPTEVAHLDAVVACARRAGNAEQAVASLAELASRLRRRSDAPALALIHTRIGELYECDLEDLESAKKAFAAAAVVEGAGSEVFLALAASARRRKEANLERRHLDRVLEATPSRRERSQTLYRLAELNASIPGAAEVALAQLAEAFALEPKVEVVKHLVGGLLADPSLSDDALNALEGLIRESEDERLLLAYIDAQRNTSVRSLELLREGVELARRLEEPAEESRFLEALSQQAATKDAKAIERWALEQLVGFSRRQGDVETAVQYQRRLVELLPEQQRAPETRKLALLVARLPTQSLVADALLKEVLADKLDDIEAWRVRLALPDALERLGQLREEIASACVDIGDIEARTELRGLWATFLVDTANASEEAVIVLRDGLADAPGSEALTAMLSKIFEASGFDAELVNLLEEQLAQAIEKKDAETILPTAGRLVSLLSRFHQDRALSLIESLETQIELDRELLLRKLELMLVSGAELAPCLELKQRLLVSEEVAQIPERAAEIAREWRTLDEHDKALEVLHAALQRVPGNAGLLQELDRGYREAGAWLPLRELLVTQARLLPEGDARRLRLIREAAALSLTELGELDRALELQREALEQAPDDLDLWADYTHTLAEAGRHQDAMAALKRQLDVVEVGSGAELKLTAALASISLDLGELVEAKAAYERLVALDFPEAKDGLKSVLEALFEVSMSQPQSPQQNAETWALLQDLFLLRQDSGQGEEALAELARFLEAVPGSVDGWRFARHQAEVQGIEDWRFAALEALTSLSEGDELVGACLEYCVLLAEAGRAAEAVGPLEDALEKTGDSRLFAQLSALYEELGNFEGLARLMRFELEGELEAATRKELALRLAALYHDKLDQPDLALPLIEEALRLEPNDSALVTRLVDVYVTGGNYSAAAEKLVGAMDALGQKRGPELSSLQYRMALVARASGEDDVQLQWLLAALEADKQNGDAAADLAELAMAQEDFDTALQALRAVTLLRNPCKMSRAQAFYLQARIATKRGEDRRAILWARKALSEDPELSEAVAFLEELEASA